MKDYLTSVQKQFDYYKSLGDKTIAQLPQEKLFWQFNEESNSLAIIVKHISGNMLSRWKDFLTSDGEKSWRNRDTEFVDDMKTKEAIIVSWEKGWDCLFASLDSLEEKDLDKIIYIRNMGHTVVEAINRQLAHYAYHIGQMVFIGKMIRNSEWESLSIPKGKSKIYNESRFEKPKERKCFTNDF